MAGQKPTTEQQAVIDHDPARGARVLAGPGTGKSFALVALLDRLHGLPGPPRVKLLTFTRAATAELAGKVSGTAAAAAHRPSTIHSFAISVLLRNPGTGGFPEPLRIADPWETDEIVEPTLARRAGFGLRQLRTLVDKMAANWQSLTEDDLGVSAGEKARFLGFWNEHRRVYGYTLLAELPYALRRALQQHDDLEGIDFDVLLVDEYQDLNACDLDVLRLIAGRGCSIVGAGDDDQSIYSGRFADPAGIRRFPRDYPDALDYELSVTKRCGSRIVDWANHVIRGDPNRSPGRAALRPADDSPEGEVALLGFAGQNSEVEGIADLVDGLIRKDGVPPGEILILLRTDYHRQFSRPIRGKLEELGVRCADPGRIDEMLAEPANRRLLALLRLLVNQRDSLAWATLLELERGIGDTFFGYVYERALPKQQTFAEALLAAHATGYPEASGGSPRKAQLLLERTSAWLRDQELPDEPPEAGWATWIMEGAAERGLPAPTSELAELLRRLDERFEEKEDLGRYLSRIQPLGRDLAQATSEGVRIMTMVGSKGLTVRATILAACEEGLVPRGDADLSEERRILYVAMTRAKEYLYVTWARRRSGVTARAGNVGPGVRLSSSFFDGGPVESEPGEAFVSGRFPRLGRRER